MSVLFISFLKQVGTLNHSGLHCPTFKGHASPYKYVQSDIYFTVTSKNPS